MSAMIVTAATMDATARSVPVLPPANGTARNSIPVSAANPPLSVLTKLERSITSAAPKTTVSRPDTIRMYSAVPLSSAAMSPPFARSITADTTKSRADTMATPLKIFLSSAPIASVTVETGFNICRIGTPANASSGYVGLRKG